MNNTASFDWEAAYQSGKEAWDSMQLSGNSEMLDVQSILASVDWQGLTQAGQDLFASVETLSLQDADR